MMACYAYYKIPLFYRSLSQTRGFSKTTGGKQSSADPHHHRCPLWALTTGIMVYATNLTYSCGEWHGGDSSSYVFGGTV